GLTKIKQEEEFKKEIDDTKTIKNLQMKREYLERLNSQATFQQMKYFLDCGFNLLIYGIGSKRRLINNFVVSYIGNDPVLVINGYHSSTTIKSITNQIIKFVQKYMTYQKCGNNVHD